MEDVLLQVARDYLPPASALALKRTGKTLAAVISENIFLRSLANHMHSTRNTDPEKYLSRLRSDKQTAFVTSLLLERGSCTYERALYPAVGRGYVKTVRVVLDFLVKTGVEIGRNPALHRSLDSACGDRATNVVRLLLAHGVDPNMQNSGEDPICSAIMSKHLPIIKLLLSYGATLPRDGGLALAAMYGSKTVTKFLINRMTPPPSPALLERLVLSRI